MRTRPAAKAGLVVCMERFIRNGSEKVNSGECTARNHAPVERFHIVSYPEIKQGEIDLISDALRDSICKN